MCRILFMNGFKSFLNVFNGNNVGYAEIRSNLNAELLVQSVMWVTVKADHFRQ